jgi:hypothetical protein
MFGPVQNVGNNSSSGQSAEALRADLMTAAPQSATELPNKAVGGTSNTQSLPDELPPHIHEVANQIGQIQSEYKVLEEKAQKAKELDELRARLLMGKKQASTGDVASPLVSQALTATDKVVALDKSNGLANQGDIKSSADVLTLKKSPVVPIKQDQPIKDPTIAGSDDQQSVILRIDEALNVLNNIIDKISSDQSKSSNKILSLTGSITGLNAARSTVDKTRLSLNVASNAVDMIMTNIKTAVMSHGKVSTDIVRLVLA